MVDIQLACQQTPNWVDPMPTFVNHDSALNFPDDMDRYIWKQLDMAAIQGPFSEIPFTSRVGVSPLSTCPKRDSVDRRVIMDLSWPPGQSVNDGIAKNQFMGFEEKLSFPTVDLIAQRVVALSLHGRENIYLLK